MQVFKVYFQVIKKNLPQMSIYLIVFVALAIAFTQFAPASASVSFSETKSRIAVINEDDNQPFAQALYDYLDKNAVIVDIETDRDALQDALFFRDAEYILRIPAGYSESFLSASDDILLEKTTAPDSVAAVSVDFLLSRYLNLAHIYTAALPDLSSEELTAHIESDLANTAAVRIDGVHAKVQESSLRYYFSFFAYSAMAIMVLGVTSILLVFGDKNLRRRNQASPVKNLSLNLQLVLGNLVFAMTVWAALCAFGFILYPREMQPDVVIPLMLNALIYTLVCLAISFLCGNLIKNKNAQSAVANVLSLGLCFISGVFVPQELLGQTVLSISSFTPTYWYVSAVQELGAGFTLTGVYAMLIQLGFAVTFLVIALAVARYKSTSSE
ncbi:MAG: ABC transporter permease [Acetanaerobacterium sp.]